MPSLKDCLDAAVADGSVSREDADTTLKLDKPEPGTADADYMIAGAPPLEVEGIPIHKPPYATLTAIGPSSAFAGWVAATNVQNATIQVRIP